MIPRAFGPVITKTYRTKFGVMLRATSQDRRMASALGINVGLVYVSAFAIGCFMAGVASENSVHLTRDQQRIRT